MSAGANYFSQIRACLEGCQNTTQAYKYNPERLLSLKAQRFCPDYPLSQQNIGEQNEKALQLL